MGSWFYRKSGRMLFAAAMTLAPAAASSQTVGPPPETTSLSAVPARVPAGAIVYVTGAGGGITKGTLVDATDDAVQVSVKGALRRLAAAEVRRIHWRQPDSPLTGVLIGAGIGAIPGIYWLIADPNECTGMCPEEYAFIAIGAAVGGLIDRAITKKVAVYTADGSRARGKRVTVGPVLTRTRKGVQLAVTF
jgi:hypothetical protein